MENKNTIIVNLVAGAGAGKSTNAAGLFYKLKMDNIDCELISEFAKQSTWEKNYTALSDQFYTSACQNYKQTTLLGKVDVIITDSPIILGLFYYTETDIVIRNSFETFLVNTFKRQRNVNFFIDRKKLYNPNGRNQTEDQAKEIDQKTINFLDKYEIPYKIIPGTPEGLDQMYKHIISEIKNGNN
jgi:hypothetical protein